MTHPAAPKFERLLDACKGLAPASAAIIVLTSRADWARARLVLCAAALLLVHARRTDWARAAA